MSIWIEGKTGSGKTTRLVKEFRHWVEQQLSSHQGFSQNAPPLQPLSSSILVLAANDDNRRELRDKLSISVQGSYPVACKTPLGFISDEVILFWPLLFERLNLKAQFPLRLRPETEQELATRLWRGQLDRENFKQTEIGEYRFVRRILDLLQLAGASGIAPEDITFILEQGLPDANRLLVSRQWAGMSSETETEKGKLEDNLTQWLGKLLLDWREWCWQRGLLSYGIIYELYWRYLLPDSKYQEHLSRRYQAVFADDVDDYPALARDLLEFLLDRDAFAIFTYNRDGQVRLGLNADPEYLAGLANRCQVEELSRRSGLAGALEEDVSQLVSEPFFLASLPDGVQSIQTTSRAELLRKTAETIIQAVKQGEVQPQDIAIIAPGLDEIARYTLMEILSSQGIAIEPLNEQRPLISSPLIRALLTLLGLVYPGLGRLILRDGVAEMLVILSRQPRETESGREGKLVPDIDPVRAGLIADTCYQIDPELPRLLPPETFSRWDRLGHRATQAYQEILAWIEGEKSLLQQPSYPNPITLLDRASKKFLANGSHLPYPQLAALRELMETAQHYWQVERKLRENEPLSQAQNETIAQFIQLLRRGTITANPRPTPSWGVKPGAVTLATVFQYRSLRGFHRWQFWLDAASHLWDKGGAATLFAAPLFLREWSGRTLMPEDEVNANQERLKRIIGDLLGRVGERIYLCHSDLGVNGTEQAGPLLPLIQAAREADIASNK